MQDANLLRSIGIRAPPLNETKIFGQHLHWKV